MKRTALVALSSLVAVVPFVACDNDSGSSSGGTFTIDGSTFDPPDGAPPPDGAKPDGPALDAPVGSYATVIVTKLGAPSAGVNVIFGDAAGNLRGTAVTDGSGTATTNVSDVQQVTVLFSTPGRRSLLTYVGVKAGDVLQVVDPAPRTVSVTLAANVPGGVPFTVAGNPQCASGGFGTGSVLLQLTPACITGTTFPVLSTVTVGADRYFSFQKGITPAATGTTDVTGMSSWTVGTPFTLNVTNVPSTTAFTGGKLGMIANDQAFVQNAALALNAGAGTATFSAPAGYADAYQGEVIFEDALPSGYGQARVFAKRIAAGVDNQALDLAAGMLPGLTGATATNMTSVRPVITWTADAALTATDSGVVKLGYTEPLDGGGSEVITWTFLVPPGTLTVTAPQLPQQFSSYAPSPAASLTSPLVAFFESDLVPGYDAVRAKAGAFATALDSGSIVTTPALPANGTVRVTALVPGG